MSKFERSINITLNSILEFICSIALHHFWAKGLGNEVPGKGVQTPFNRNYRNGQAYQTRALHFGSS
jgi:hypothetical protein